MRLYFVCSLTPFNLTRRTRRQKRKTHLPLALDENDVEGFVEGCLQWIGEDNSEEEQNFRDLRKDETQREVVIDCLQADCEVTTGRPPGL